MAKNIEKSGEPFISPEYRDELVERKWRPAAKEHYKDRRQGRWVAQGRTADRNLEGYIDPDLEAETINEMHGVDFLNTLIPNLIRKNKESGNKRKIKILDLGGGYAFFGDQIRSRFGDDVEVYSTNIVRAAGNRRKKRMVEGIKKDDIVVPAEDKAKILGEISDSLHPNDAKWRSVLEMRNFPEFDLIVDSSGEMLYAGKGFLPSDSYSDEVFDAAVKKLNPGGQFFIGRLHNRDSGRLENHKEKLESKYGVSIEHNKASVRDTAFIITKPELPNQKFHNLEAA